MATLSEEVGVFSHCDYINKILSIIYGLIHEEKFPRVTEEMRKGLQLKKGKATGDWFLYQGSTLIGVYDFQGFSYVLPAFLTPIIFYLEFARQILSLEELHFMRAHKTSNLKSPFTLGTFTFKSKSCVAILDSYMCQFQFLLAPMVRYDPLDVISKRKKRKTTKAREHEGLKDREKIANKEEPLEGQSFIGLTSQVPRGIDEPLLEIG